MQGYKEQLNFKVVDLEMPYDVICGDDWATRLKAIACSDSNFETLEAEQTNCI